MPIPIETVQDVAPLVYQVSIKVRFPILLIAIPALLLLTSECPKMMPAPDLFPTGNQPPVATSGGSNNGQLAPKQTMIAQDYEISGTVLGLGINGKVVQCFSRRTGGKYALKVLHENPKSIREVEIHYRASHSCR